LTSGPSSSRVAESKKWAYSMAGSLWRQRIDSKTAQQLRTVPGYGLSADWSSGRKKHRVRFVSKDAIELWFAGSGNGKTQQITNRRGGERGAALVSGWKSASCSRRLPTTSRFHVFRADVRDGTLENAVRLPAETRAARFPAITPAVRMEISPVWTRDGQEKSVRFDTRTHSRTGGFWRMKRAGSGGA